MKTRLRARVGVWMGMLALCASPRRCGVAMRLRAAPRGAATSSARRCAWELLRLPRQGPPARERPRRNGHATPRRHCLGPRNVSTRATPRALAFACLCFGGTRSASVWPDSVEAMAAVAVAVVARACAVVVAVCRARGGHGSCGGCGRGGGARRRGAVATVVVEVASPRPWLCGVNMRPEQRWRTRVSTWSTRVGLVAAAAWRGGRLRLVARG